MKDLRGSASTRVAASPEKCTALLAAVDGYPRWYPKVIRKVEVLERDDAGLPKRAKAFVHMALGPAARDFEFEVEVAVDPGRQVLLSRVPHHGRDNEELEIRWIVARSELRVELAARVELPRLLPLSNGIGDAVAQGFVETARRALNGSNPKAPASSS